MKPRIETIAPGVTSEVIALQTTMLYDPASSDVQIIFSGRPCMFSDTTYLGPGGDPYPITTHASSIIDRTFGEGTDAVTGADLSTISVAGAMAIIKAAFAKLYDEEQSRPAPVAPTAPELPEA